MGRIAHFIGIDADVARCDGLIEANKIVGTKGGIVAKGFDDPGAQEVQEAMATGDLHLKEQTL